MRLNHFWMALNIGFSSSCTGVLPSCAPGIVFVRPCHTRVECKFVVKVVGHRERDKRTNFSNMHLFSVRSGLRHMKYS